MRCQCKSQAVEKSSDAVKKIEKFLSASADIFSRLHHDIKIGRVREAEDTNQEKNPNPLNIMFAGGEA